MWVPPPRVFQKCFILKLVKVLYLDTLLQVFILTKLWRAQVYISVTRPIASLPGALLLTGAVYQLCTYRVKNKFAMGLWYWEAGSWLGMRSDSCR